MPIVASSNSFRTMLASRLSRPRLGCVVAGAAALGCLAVVPVPEARAACIGGNDACTTFTPSTVSTPAGVGAFTGTGSAIVSDPFTQAQIRFAVSNFTGSPFTISGISLAGPGIGAPISLGSVNVTGNSTFATGFVNLTTPVTSFNFDPSSKISFTIPAGVVNVGATIGASIRYMSADPNNNYIVTSSQGFSTTAVVPGPLPLVGAGVAFGFSRRLRRRIASVS